MVFDRRRGLAGGAAITAALITNMPLLCAESLKTCRVVLKVLNFKTNFTTNSKVQDSMECSVCYGESGPFQKLCCGHVFCKGCIKSWYLKGVSSSGANASCPMCRRPMYFRGFHAVREEWDDDAWENKCADVFSEAIDMAFEEAQEFAESFPERFRGRIMRDVIEDVLDIEKTYRFLKSVNASSEDIEYVLLYTGDYYSDRHINKWNWCDEPKKGFETRYPWLKQSRTGSQKRVRAREDPWVTVSFYIEV